jgi:tetratricopeptide (TPR) repeat protein
MESYKSLLELASELISSNALEHAKAATEKAYEKASHPREKVEVLCFKAGLHKAMADFKVALDSYDQALKILSALEDGNSDDVLFQASIHISKSLLLQETEIKKAIKELKTAEKIFHSFTGQNALFPINKAAYTSYLLVQCFSMIKDHYQWRKYAKQAIDLYGRTEDASTSEPMIAHLYGSLGESFEEEDYTYAILYWNKSKDYYKSLCETDDSFLAYLAAAYNNLAVNQKRNFEHHKAAQNYMKSLEFYLKLSESQGLEYKPFVAAAYNSLGILFSEMYDKAEALNYYLKALSIYQDLSQDYPEMFLPYLGTIKHNIGVYFDDLKDYNKALSYYQEALAIRESIAKSGTTALKLDQAVTVLNILTVYQTLLEKEADFSMIDKAITLIEKTKNVLGHEILQNNMAEGILGDLDYFQHYFLHTPKKDIIIHKAINDAIKLDDLYADTDDAEEKKTILLKNISNLEAVFKGNQDHIKLKERLDSAYTHYAWLNLLEKKFDVAEHWLKKSLKINNNAFPTLINLAHITMLKSDFLTAKPFYDKALGLSQKENINIKNVIEKDLLQFAIHGISHPDLEKVKKLF